MCWVDAALADLLGYKPHELMGRPFEEITHPPDRDLDSHLAERLFAGSLATYRIEKRFIRKDKSLVQLEVNASVIRDVNGTPLYGIGIVRSVEESSGSTAGSGMTPVTETEQERIRRAIFGS